MASTTPSERTFPGLPTTTVSSTARSRVCIVTDDLVGPIRNGGIGTANTALAETLARAGHHVTVLFAAGSYSERHSIDHWIADYGTRGIELVPLPTLSQPYVGGDHLSRSYEIFLWLKRGSFDVIHFHEWHGRGYYSCLAKRLGLAFSQTRLCVTTHSPLLWHKLQNHESIDSLWEIEMDFMERQSVELCDVLISPSQYMLRWLLAEGWRLPTHAFVQQNLLPPLPFGLATPNPTVEPVRELVFFGRLEPRKGLLLVCDALDKLPTERQRGLLVTFLGKDSTVHGMPSSEYVHRRSKGWQCRQQCLTDRSYAEALSYLRQPGRVALMASLADNSPYTVLECLHSGIPFLASHIGGIPDLIAEEDHELILFSPQPAALADRLSAVLTSGLRRSKPRIDVSANEQAWIQWHTAQCSVEDKPLPSTKQPSLTICVADLDSTVGETSTLGQRLASVAMQEGPPVAGLLVVSAIDAATAGSMLEQALGPAAKNWRVLAQPGLDHAKARRWAAQTALGEYVLMLDGALATPQAVTILRQAAAQAEAVAFTWISDELSSPSAASKLLTRRLPLGGCAAAGLFRECFGGPSWLIRRDALLSLCEEAFDTKGDDVPALLAKLVLSGHRLEVIPAVLSQCVKSETQSNESSNHQIGISAYKQATPRELWPALLFARSLFAGQKQAGLSPNMSQVLSELVRLEHELRRYPRLYGAARQLFQQGVRVSRSVLGKKRGAGESTIGH